MIAALIVAAERTGHFFFFVLVCEVKDVPGFRSAVSRIARCFANADESTFDEGKKMYFGVTIPAMRISK